MIATVLLLGFGGIGGASWLTGLVAGRRRFQLPVERRELSPPRRGPCGRKMFRWHRDHLDAVEVISRGTHVYGRALDQGFIRSRKRPAVGIMTGHDRADLGLIANAVQEQLVLTNYNRAPE